MLKSDGKVLMAGEPIFSEPNDYLPFSWGIRMDANNISVMRERGWMELGFQESFLRNLFAEVGFDMACYPCENSQWA
jgi:hypothetical protein